MNIYHVEFAKTGYGLTGGEVCMIELIKYFQGQGLDNIMLTTDNGKETYIKEIPESEHLKYKTIKSFKDELRYGILLSYLIRTIRAVRLVRKLHLQPDDLVICHSDFFPNSIPAWVVNKNNPHAKSANLFHMKAPGLFRGYEGEFTGRYQIPRLTIINYKLNQWLYRLLTRRSAVIFTVNLYYEAYLKKKYPHNRIKILESFWGADHDIQTKRAPSKDFDLIWVGRLHPQKGISDLVLTIKEVTRQKPNLKVLIIGDEPGKAKTLFVEQQKKLSVTKNIHMAGFIGGNDKFDYILKSKIFVMPSYYESFGGVILEAMACGLPVVSYDLPIYEVFKPAILTVPVLDYKAMAQKIIVLLSQSDAYKEAVNNSLAVAKKHSWAKTGEEILGQFV
jgi:glycosyltransferase involved in cell wall biosynthesis